MTCQVQIDVSEQARRFDRAAAVAVDAADDLTIRRLVGVAATRTGKPPRSPASQRLRAALAGARSQFYSDVLMGRKGSSGTVLEWLTAWRAAGAPDLDVTWVLFGEEDELAVA